ncbi:MAG TPA: hypothetical protein VLK33_14175 [Terriglobales bacterium]|nr:hypothetical protein [Terriglobales bacterium]
MKLCILFFFLVLITYEMCSLFALGLPSVANKGHFHLSQRLILVSAFCFSGLLLLVLSRFALAVPAVVLDQSTAWRAVFRSDELTQGKWSTLAALLAKSLVGGYVAAMLPYWVSPWIPASIVTFSWYPWIQVLVSTLAVAVVEPPMFIGFALLYLKMREESSSPEAPKFTTIVSSA